MDAKKIIPPYEYLNGADFVDTLKTALNCRSHQELADKLSIPKSTFSTWSKHDRTSHELMVRLHLALGIPIEELALKPEDRMSSIPASEVHSPTSNSREPTTKYAKAYALAAEGNANQKKTVILKSFCLSNGKLIDTGEIPYSIRRLNGFSLEKSELIEIETNQGVVLIDKKENDAMNGNYLIGIDGRYSMNQVQRLPGKLAIAFDGQTIEVQEGDIEVIGKVVLETKLK
jgi:hypothetical protein